MSRIIYVSSDGRGRTSVQMPDGTWIMRPENQANVPPPRSESWVPEGCYHRRIRMKGWIAEIRRRRGLKAGEHDMPEELKEPLSWPV